MTTTSTDNNTNNNNDVAVVPPMTFLMATAKIQKLGLKQRSNRRFGTNGSIRDRPTSRRSLSSGTGGGVGGSSSGPPLMSKDTQERIRSSLSMSERLPLQTPEDRALHYGGGKGSSAAGTGGGDMSMVDEMSPINGDDGMEIVEGMSTKEALMDICFGKFVSVFLLVTPVTLWANMNEWEPVLPVGQKHLASRQLKRKQMSIPPDQVQMVRFGAKLNHHHEELNACPDANSVGQVGCQYFLVPHDNFGKSDGATRNVTWPKILLLSAAVDRRVRSCCHEQLGSLDVVKRRRNVQSPSKPPR